MRKTAALAALVVFVLALAMPAAKAETYCVWLGAGAKNITIVNRTVCVYNVPADLPLWPQPNAQRTP